jgi:dTMP kinase
MDNQPKFIVVDGPDGAGKTTIVKELSNYLTVKGYNVLLGKGLGTGSVAEAIRKSLFDKDHKKTSNYEIYGMIMSLIDCYESFIVPNLLKNDDKLIIILDRYISSYYAYQVYARSCGKANKMLRDAFNIYGTRHPDLYIHCKVDLDVATKRINERNEEANYLDKESEIFRGKVTEGFNVFFKDRYLFHTCSPSKIIELDCNQTLDGVYQQLYTYLENTFVSKLTNDKSESLMHVGV